MKTNKLIIYAAIGVGLWLLFRKKKEIVYGEQHPTGLLPAPDKLRT